MSCDCLANVRASLDRHHGPRSDVCLELKATINLKTGIMTSALPPLYYKFTKGKKRSKSYVTFNFCPFCGKSLSSPATTALSADNEKLRRTGAAAGDGHPVNARAGLDSGLQENT